jgi:hypothetical protein
VVVTTKDTDERPERLNPYAPGDVPDELPRDLQTWPALIPVSDPPQT